MTFENDGGLCLAGTRSGRSLWVALCALGLAYAVAGCADSDESDCDGVDTSAAALYGGKPDYSGSLDSSLVAVWHEFDDARDSRLCSGALIATGVVLTAQHCVIAGGHNKIEFGPSLSYPVSELDIDHFVTDFEGDLALAVYDPTVKLNAKPIPTRADPELSVGDSVTLTGFGENESGSIGLLRFVDEPVTELDDQTITVDGRGKSGACVGDSGAPLLWHDPATNDVQVIGVLSVGSPSCTGIDVYQRIDPTLDERLKEIEADPKIEHPYGPEGPSRPYEGC